MNRPLSEREDGTGTLAMKNTHRLLDDDDVGLGSTPTRKGRGFLLSIGKNK